METHSLPQNNKLRNKQEKSSHITFIGTAGAFIEQNDSNIF
jgi:hypothetical protein